MWLLSLFACSSDPVPEPVPEPPKEVVPSADDVLQRHIKGTNQCELLSQANYTLGWDTVTTNTKLVRYSEKVIQHGRQGLTFSRIHERISPNWGFTAIGKLPDDGNYWSASDGGVIPIIKDDRVAKQMMQNLDPTPLCGFEARWKDRVNLGSDDYEGRDSWRLMLTWNDGNVSEAWFDKELGVLLGMLTKSEGFEQRRGFDDYLERSGGVRWPTQEKMMTTRGEEKLIVLSKLTKLEVGRKGFIDLGPLHIHKLLQEKVKDGTLLPPGQKIVEEKK